jgi:hypothetical protein
MKFHLTLISSNAKTGKIPVSTSAADTCPDACPFKRGGGCYAQSGPLALHWAKISGGVRGGSWQEFLGAIRTLPVGQFWRHNQAGDLPGANNKIDARALRELVAANQGKKGFTYTHKPTTRANVAAIRHANENGFVVNLSGNSLSHADTLSAHGLPVVCVLPSEAVANRSVTTPQGRKVVICPATRSKSISCDTCRLCAKKDRPFVIGFPAHGTGARKASAIAAKGDA